MATSGGAVDEMNPIRRLDSNRGVGVARCVIDLCLYLPTKPGAPPVYMRE
jgi:hypothetical protein